MMKGSDFPSSAPPIDASFAPPAQALKLPVPLALALGAAAAPRMLVEEIAAQLIELLDLADGDLDLEDSELGVSWVDDRGRDLREAAIGGGSFVSQCDEDAEDDDPIEFTRVELINQTKGAPALVAGKLDYDDDDEDSESDFDVGSENEPDLRRRRRRTQAGGPGCPISDSDYCMAGEDRIISGPSPGGQQVMCRGAGDEADAEMQERFVPRFGVDQTRDPLHLISSRRGMPIEDRLPRGSHRHADQRWRGDGGRSHAE